MTIRVLLADDQALLRAGFRLLLSAADDIDVVGEAANGGTAVALAREERPDVVLMDLRMPEVDGLTATRLITADPALATVRVVVLTTFDDDESIFAALRAGASGFLVKDVEPADLLHAVRVVARGDALLSPSVTRAVIAQFASGRRPHRARTRGRLPGRGRAVQRGDRHQADGQPAHGENPRHPGHDQTVRPRPRPAGRPRLRTRPGLPPARLASALTSATSGATM
jgi:DNA-binding NarL/FixJ family response regulator